MRVLLVEDDRMIGAAVMQALKDAAYAVDWVTDGETALEAAEAESYDVALLDLVLPQTDGQEVLRRRHPLPQRPRTSHLRMERGSREQRRRIPDPYHTQEARGPCDPQCARRRLDGGSSLMTDSLRGRLFIGLTFMIVLVGLGAGVVAFRWAYDKAIEMQDSILIKIGPFAMDSRLQKDTPFDAGVDAEARVNIEELGDRPSGTPDTRALWTLQDGLHVVSRDQKPWRILLRTRRDGSRFAVGQATEVRDEMARDSALHAILPFAAMAPLPAARHRHRRLAIAATDDRTRRTAGRSALRRSRQAFASRHTPRTPPLHRLDQPAARTDKGDDGAAAAFRCRRRARTSNADHRDQSSSREPQSG